MQSKHTILKLNDRMARHSRRATASCILHIPNIDARTLKTDSFAKGSWRASALAGAALSAKSIGYVLLFCHPRQLDELSISFHVSKQEILITAEVSSTGRVGIDMEAMAAVVGAALGAIDVIRSYDPEVDIANAHIQRNEEMKHE